MNDSRRRPNIVIILTDDQGIGQVPCYADKLSVSDFVANPTPRYACDPERALTAARQAMPHLRQLAADGVVCSDAHVTSPVCGPSRCALMTGRYGQRFGVYINADANQGLPTSEVCLAENLQAAGYRTGIVGKWHLGKRIATKVESDSRDYHHRTHQACLPEHHPRQRGFDYYFGFNATGTPYYDSPSLYRDHDPVAADGFITDQFSQEAEDFIAGSDQPFFLYLPYSAPHIPLEDRAPAHYRQRFDTGNPEVDNYYAHLAAVDDGIGRLIAALRRKGQYENTLFFFLSDNGGVVDSPQPVNGPFIGYKGRQRQGGCRTPLIVSWPAGLARGTECDELVASIDIMPTALAAAGLEVPRHVDGINLLPLLRGRESMASRSLFWASSDNFHWSEEDAPFWTQYWTWLQEESDEPAERTPDGKKSPPAFAVRHGQWFMHCRTDEPATTLLHVGSNENQADAYPDVVAAMTGLYREWMAEMQPPVRWEREAWDSLAAAARTAQE